jgi:molybdopterin-guanine dinucleotide biosynthesis protein
LRNATEEEIVEAFKNMSPEDKIFVTKKEPEYEPTAEEIEKAIEVLNEEPLVKAVEEAVEEVKKITKKVDRTFGYLWNGQAIDF